MELNREAAGKLEMWFAEPLLQPHKAEYKRVGLELRDTSRHIWTYLLLLAFSSVQLLSRAQLCNPMNCSTPGFPVHHQLPELAQTHAHRVSDVI